ncbi:MAG: biotin transporter BioY [Rhodobacteraceae bacterium]|jgi:biotin transport system substrate-specific component|nr:biotin transporter BioY [Paracoccaceae bacterium]MBL4556462.1 biotin transporter BioY [Paracoccaceae bacterium]
MAVTAEHRVLSEAVWPMAGAAIWVRRAVLVVLGIAALAAAAKIRLAVPGSPVPVNMGTFAVLTVAAAYGPRLGLATILGYLLIGALGFDVFAGSSAELAGWTYMTGSTGGYLLGFVLATLALGWAARRGLDRSVAGMAGAMAVGMALIYLPGVLWLGVLYGWNEPILAWGLYPFLIGDALKLGLAALIVPGLWRLVGAARG